MLDLSEQEILQKCISIGKIIDEIQCIRPLSSYSEIEINELKKKCDNLTAELNDKYKDIDCINTRQIVVYMKGIERLDLKTHPQMRGLFVDSICKNIKNN